MSLELVEAVVGVRDSVSKDIAGLCWVPAVLSVRAFSSPHGVGVAGLHRREDPGSQQAKGWGQPGATAQLHGAGGSQLSPLEAAAARADSR